MRKGPNRASVGPIKRGPHEVTLHFEWREGRWECVEVNVKMVSEHLRPITTSVLRSLPIAGLIEKHRPGSVESLTTADMDGTIYTTEHDYRSKPKPQGGRPPEYGPEHWEKVAQVYREAFAKNRTPTRAVARRFKVTPSAAAKWVAQCRERGLLPRTTRGKARAVAPPAKDTKRKGK